MDLGYEQWHADMHDREIDEVIRTRAPIRGEIPFSGTNGTRVYDYIFAPVFGAEGEVVAVAGTTRDVTDRQAAEQALREQAASWPRPTGPRTTSWPRCRTSCATRSRRCAIRSPCCAATA
jgi:hypothetical protein